MPPEGSLRGAGVAVSFRGVSRPLTFYPLCCIIP